MKEVTIILPVYSPNYKFLKECLSSIESQTISKNHFDLLIGCDGRINNKIRGLLDNYVEKNDFAKYKIFHRGGLKNTLNKLVNLCDTKFIARMDADDVMENNRLEFQLNFLKNNPDVKLLGTAIRLFPNKKFNIKYHPTNTFTILLFGAIYGNPFSHPTIMCESKIIKKILYTHESPYEDYALWCKFAKFGKLKNINNPLLKYRVHEMQISSKKLSYKKMIKIRISYAKIFFSKYKFVSFFILPIFILLFLPHKRTI